MLVVIIFIYPYGLGSHQIYSADTFLNPSDASIAFESLWGIVPHWMVTVMHRLPTKRLRRLQNYMKTASEVAQALVDRQVALHATGKEGAKDVMSILSNYIS